MIKYKKTALAKAMESKIALLDFAPTRATDGSSGFDLRACIEQPIKLNPYDVAKIGTGVHIWIGQDEEHLDLDMLFAGLLMPRSSSDGAILNNTIGLLDSDYQGELFCKYRNLTNESITFEPGEKFAQLIIVPTLIEKMVEVEAFDDETVRGEGGFGHTGK
jgi:dUTP pyrophosphatase